jgi:DNA-binding transcriptional ArsR family regulator
MTLDLSNILSQQESFPPIEEVLSSKGKIKILKILTLYDELNISEIVRKVQLNHATVTQHLAYFRSVGIVSLKVFGRIKIYQLTDNVKVRVIRELIEFWERSMSSSALIK